MKKVIVYFVEIVIINICAFYKSGMVFINATILISQSILRSQYLFHYLLSGGHKNRETINLN